jgi:hypothetical protein
VWGGGGGGLTKSKLEIVPEIFLDNVVFLGVNIECPIIISTYFQIQRCVG